MIPGADIVGFEYEAKSEQDVALVNNALSKFDDFVNACHLVMLNASLASQK